MDNDIVTSEEKVSKRVLTFSSVLKSLLEMREMTILLIVLVFCVVLSLSSPYFLTSTNAMIIINGLALDIIIAVGMTIALIGGNIDFSVGSTLGVSGFVTALLLQRGTYIPLSILIGILVGIILGFLNGIMVVKLKVLPIVVTMGTWMGYKGLGLMIVGSSAIANLPKAFSAISQKWNLFGIPFNILIMIVVVIIGMWLLKYINFFHQAFFIGGNVESARLAGINVNKFIIIIYSIIGGLAALSGVLMISRLGSAPASLGQGMEFRIVTAMLIGGVSFLGGEGSILGAFLGALLMGIISNALAIFGINAYLQLVIVGIILIFAVALDESNRRRKSSK